ncbi:hypothetical protein DFH27DRAFT_590732 [Peziza echinospora]|nr:hypothetical protein DFH27DRAFT_590732 [Peziza echinospora]
MKSFSLILIAALTSIVSANSLIDTSAFESNNGQPAALAAAPVLHFGRPHGYKPCYPSPAVSADGSQTNGTPADGGIWGKLNPGCGDPGDWRGQNTAGNPFPVYYTVEKCGSGEYRVAYSVYFSHDSGHMSDWENVVVVWRDRGGGKWGRERVMLGQHGKWETLKWADIQNTVDGQSDINTQGARDRDHPKVYIGAFRHAIFHTRKTTFDTMATADKDEFRSNDWMFLPTQQWLQLGNVVKPEWTWGKADTNPATLRNGGFRYMCKS